MIDEETIVRKSFSDLLGWEKTKRRERVLALTLFYSLLVSFVFLPFREGFDSGFLALPLLFFLILTPGLLLWHRWGKRDSLRALALLDKTLRLEERVVTAWEILGRNEKKAPELLVIKEAAQKLDGIDPKSLFKRHFTWHSFSALPLLLLWLLFAWHDGAVHVDAESRATAANAAAREVVDYSRELKKRAGSQGLSRSLAAARSLEEAGEKSLRGEPKGKSLKDNLAGVMHKIGEMESGVAAGGDRRFSGATKEELSDLRTEVETLREALTRSGSLNDEWVGPEVMEKFQALPRLKEEIGKDLFLKEKIRVKGLLKLLDRLEQGLVAELDRRTLKETQEFLALILRRGEGEGEDEGLIIDLGRDRFSPSVVLREPGGRSPGSQLGKKDPSFQSGPLLREGLATQLKGQWRKGGGSSLMFRSESQGKESKTPQEEVPTRYRRRAEEELASEQIPEGLKETVRRYFLSLGVSGKKGE